MKKFLNKRYISVVLGVVLVIAGIVNRNYKQPVDSQTAKILGEAAYVNNNVKVDDKIILESETIKREKSRDEAKEMLEDIIKNPATTEEGRKQAEQEMINMAKAIKQEADCEMLLKQKGFENAVVTITDNSASINVNIKDIMSTEIAQITEIVSSVSGIGADRIKILSGDWYSQKFVL